MKVFSVEQYESREKSLILPYNVKFYNKEGFKE